MEASEPTTTDSTTDTEANCKAVSIDADVEEKKSDKYKTTSDQNPYFQSAPLLTTQEEIILGKQIQTYIRYQKRYLKLESKNLLSRTAENCAGGGEDDFVTWGRGCGYWDEPSEKGWKEDLEEFVPSIYNKNSGPGAQRDGGRRRSATLSLGKAGLDSDTDISEWGKVWKGGRSDFVKVMREGRDARQRMIESNMRLVISISRKYTIYGVSQSDLIQEGR
ncbi:hypothetical protein TrRE_jg12314 [Triparma retinervis]|uniref:Uncharacterized protein n=1 Tax=Triparma retinervis TaxID=2557542 RepID=A0A9W7ATS5_9STRA|nr:hypothetical protein TrRE_jg12314 [Triparma retinervis]